VTTTVQGASRPEAPHATRVVVVTSCTGEKAVDHPDRLTLADFRRGPAHVAAREAGLAASLRRARDLYTGQQHVRLMRGLAAVGGRIDVTVHVLSAGYGLVPADRELAPYEATFQGMGAPDLRRWADTLGIPQAFRNALAGPFDLALVLLGDRYLDACALARPFQPGGPMVVFCGPRAQARLPRAPGIVTVALSNDEARRFGCPLVSLKGELGARLLRQVAADPGVAGRLARGADPLATLEAPTGAPRTGRRGDARPDPTVDRVISLPPEWLARSRAAPLKYFIPEWDDLVDPNYDFATDTHRGGMSDWSNEAYAHQMYPTPSYDGILVSKVVAEKSVRKRERIGNLGVHRFVRVPPQFPIIGDCGAFGYVMDEIPPYRTPEILDYYTRLGFDYGVSIDHLIVASTDATRQARYDLTIGNAEEFLVEHRRRGLRWEPVGAVQGWDPASYARAAAQYVAMGYRSIGLGGLVRTPTREVLAILHEVHASVRRRANVHLFGLARLGAMRQFADLGVTSVDSASLLRRAWMGTGQNYLTEAGRFYAAIRVPEGGKSFRAKRMVAEGRASADEVARLEGESLRLLRAYDAGDVPASRVLDVVVSYDRLITADRSENRDLLAETLEARPWRDCPCEICRRDGVEVIIFRGNNRNRRRGFHNTWAFYRLLQRALAGEPVALSGSLPKGAGRGGQLTLDGLLAPADDIDAD
jgi:hypothetical protein